MKVRTPEAQGLDKANQELRLPELAGGIGSPRPCPEEGGIEVAVVEDEDVDPPLEREQPVPLDEALELR